jgi:hypothetical protein
MPAATRFTRATGDCLRVDLRLLFRVLLLRALDVLLPPRLELLREELPPDLRAELFLRAGPRLAAVLLDARLLPDLLPPVLRADLPALFRVALRVLLLPVLRVLLRVLLPVLLRLVFRAPVLREAALRATVLRRPPDVFDRDPRFAPVLEPAVRLELLRDDFLVAMLYSGTMLIRLT